MMDLCAVKTYAHIAKTKSVYCFDKMRFLFEQDMHFVFVWLNVFF